MNQGAQNRPDDSGFVCKNCGRFFADAEVQEWDTTWEQQGNEPWLRELSLKCPHCGQVRTYRVREATLRGLQDNDRFPSE